LCHLYFWHDWDVHTYARKKRRGGGRGPEGGGRQYSKRRGDPGRTGMCNRKLEAGVEKGEFRASGKGGEMKTYGRGSRRRREGNHD